MKKIEIIKAIESAGKYTKVKIDKSGVITGMLVNENYTYSVSSNTGGRRFLGYANESKTMRIYGID
jgi:hypothetical protein